MCLPCRVTLIPESHDSGQVDKAASLQLAGADVDAGAVGGLQVMDGLTLELVAEFEELLQRTKKDDSVRRVLQRYQAQLVSNAITSELALQALAQEDLQRCGVTLGDAAVLKQAFPTPSATAASPATDLRNWMVRHHEPPADPTAAALSDLIQQMPLPEVLRELLRTSIHPVPAEGLFACSSYPLAEDIACPRQDVVQALLKAANSQPFAFVACIGGRHRQGKSFSNPWAQLEAIRLLESQAAGHQAARSRYVFYLSCLSQERNMPTVDEQILLLATLAYLRIPAVFDEFSSWPTLPPAVESYLSGHLCRPGPTLSLRPLQFVLQDSSPSYVRGVLGGQGVLYGRQNLGVLPLVRMPEPSVHLVAGMLQAHHPGVYYPSSLLRIMCTHGRSLHRLASTPRLPLLEVGDLEVSDLTRVKGEHLNVLTVVVSGGAARIGRFESGAGEARQQLVDAGYLDVEPRESDRVVLSDPVMITRSVLRRSAQHRRIAASQHGRAAASQHGRTRIAASQHGRVAVSKHSPLPEDGEDSPPPDDRELPSAADTGMDSGLEAAAERLLPLAEGKVLKVLARKELLHSILENLGYADKGRYYLWWGRLGAAEFDLLIYFLRGPVILVCCQHTQSAQSAAAFTDQITALADTVAKRRSSSGISKRSRKGAAVDVTDIAGKAIVQALTAPGSELIMVGLSAQPVPNHQLKLTQRFNITSTDGEQRSVQCRYVPLLLEQLVRPVTFEPVKQAVPLSG